MPLPDLLKKIENNEARMGVIGLGYVGLPVACLFAEAGYDVIGIDIRKDRIDQINAGVSPIKGKEPGLADLLSRVVDSKKLRASIQYNDLSDRDVIIISVETPVDETRTPRYEALKAALRSLALVMKPGALIIVESTVAPGSINEIVEPILSESGGKKVSQDFFLGYCPERVMPGRLIANLQQMSRVVGGDTPETAEIMVNLYRKIVHADLDPVDCVTAELVKTVENAYRDVQIAFVNEVALICESVGGDVWKVRELVNKSPGRHMLLPGAGVGGHCIPKDPWLLAYGVKDKPVPLRVIPAARGVNDFMPRHMADLVGQALQAAGKEIAGARVLVMGYAYLEDSDDTRNSPSETLAQSLLEMGAEVIIHDPFVTGYQGDIINKASGCDAVVVMVRHREYQQLDLRGLKSALKLPILVDGRGVYQPQKVYEAGLDYWGVGLSKQT